jgi:hypothetical protein
MNETSNAMGDEDSEGAPMGESKNLTPTIFGLLIAYFAPGTFVVITAGLLFHTVGTFLTEFSKASSSTGLAILLFLTALLAGMQLNICQWAVYEEWLLRGSALSSKTIAKLKTPAKAAQFQLLIDHVYRYHQFAGAQSFVIPVFAYALYVRMGYAVDKLGGYWLIAAALIIEGLTVWSAIAGGRRYFERCTALANEV